MAVYSLQWIGRADYMDSCGICRKILHIELFFKELSVKTNYCLWVFRSRKHGSLH